MVSGSSIYVLEHFHAFQDSKNRDQPQNQISFWAVLFKVILFKFIYNFKAYLFGLWRNCSFEVFVKFLWDS